MKITVFVAGTLIAVAASPAFAQDMSRDELNQRPQTTQRDNGTSPTARMNESSQGGVPAGSADSGSLMQQREQGMAPHSSQTPAKSSNSTGTMKQ